LKNALPISLRSSLRWSLRSFQLELTPGSVTFTRIFLRAGFLTLSVSRVTPGMINAYAGVDDRSSVSAVQAERRRRGIGKGEDDQIVHQSTQGY
jgi:hypothetical protein